MASSKKSTFNFTTNSTTFRRNLGALIDHYPLISDGLSLSEIRSVRRPIQIFEVMIRIQCTDFGSDWSIVWTNRLEMVIFFNPVK